MRNLVYCCDGTGRHYGPVNSNIVHLHQRLLRDPGRQLCRYEPGLGTGGYALLSGTPRSTWLARLFGYGLTAHLLSGYRFLMEHYQPGDRVFLFGFSRGAYAVRALSGMLARVGLLETGQENLLEDALRVYTRIDRHPQARGFSRTYARDCPVHFIGLWDTVASLGFVYRQRLFFDTALCPDVRHGYHVLALDERRPRFEPLLWDERRVVEGQQVEQVWFNGAHGDVGGVYGDRALADISFEWLWSRALRAGLLPAADLPALKPDPLGRLHTPWESPSGRLLSWLHLGQRPRQPAPGSLVHASVLARHQWLGESLQARVPEYRLVDD